MERRESEPTTTYEVKLYHPQQGPACSNSGKSEYRTIEAINKAMLRKEVETHGGSLFLGDRCRKCGELAKVSIS